MNEEQPNFKVTDRRLFNADGSPRDVPPAEKPEPPAEQKPEPKPATRPEPRPPAAEPAVAAAAAQTQAEREPEIRAAAPEEAPALDDGLTDEERADADSQDPASFVSFVMSIASNAASSLGMLPHPVTQQREVDMELGKHWIDILGMLQKKTAGNLTLPEKNMLEALLHDLRLQYVTLTNAPQKPPAFTGPDITGGR